MKWGASEGFSRARCPRLRLLGTRDSESIVGILELRGNAGARGDAAYFDVVAPGAASRGLANPMRGTLGISLRGMLIVGRVVPIGAPFVDVVAHVVKAVGAWRIQGDRFRAILPALAIIG